MSEMKMLMICWIFVSSVYKNVETTKGEKETENEDTKLNNQNTTTGQCEMMDDKYWLS